MVPLSSSDSAGKRVNQTDMKSTRAALPANRLFKSLLRTGFHHRAACRSTQGRVLNGKEGSEERAEHAAGPCHSGHPGSTAPHFKYPYSIRNIVGLSGGNNNSPCLSGQFNHGTYIVRYIGSGGFQVIDPLPRVMIHSQRTDLRSISADTGRVHGIDQLQAFSAAERRGRTTHRIDDDRTALRFCVPFLLISIY